MPEHQLIDYLPPVLRDIRDFGVITQAQQPEIAAAWEALAFVMDNQFIDTATQEGVSMWEKELNIAPLATDSLEDRKKRILAAWAYGVAYTYRWLIGWVRACCGGACPEPSLNEYTLRVYLPASVDYRQLINALRRYVSAGVRLDPLILLSGTQMPHYTGSAFRRAAKQTLTSDAWDTNAVNLLADENGKVLVDGPDNNVLFEEVAENDT